MINSASGGHTSPAWNAPRTHGGKMRRFGRTTASDGTNFRARTTRGLRTDFSVSSRSRRCRWRTLSGPSCGGSLTHSCPARLLNSRPCCRSAATPVLVSPCRLGCVQRAVCSWLRCFPRYNWNRRRPHRQLSWNCPGVLDNRSLGSAEIPRRQQFVVAADGPALSQVPSSAQQVTRPVHLCSLI